MLVRHIRATANKAHDRHDRGCLYQATELYAAHGVDESWVEGQNKD
jgi:hypothetical protein